MTGPFSSMLHREDRGRLESCLGQDLSGVRLVRQPHFPRWRPVLGSSSGEEVYVAPGLPPLLRLAVLAHEAAHVVQRRRAQVGVGAAGSADALEAEADGAARAMLEGARADCRLADCGGVPRAWGVVGHYYTVLFVMLAVGVEKNLAGRQAFYAQMPDLVREFDATFAGGRLVVVPAVTAGSLKSRQMDADYTVQEGLHCLTGGHADKETKYRTDVLANASLDSLAFGVGLHPFGDSYAHRVLSSPSVLYSRGMGHLVDASRPDDISTRADLYVRYGLDLYDVVANKSEVRNAKRLIERAGVEDALGGFATDASWTALGDIKRSIKNKLGYPIDRYAPDDGTTLWSRFQGQFALPTGMFADVMQLAWIWAHRQQGSPDIRSSPVLGS